MCEIKNNYMAVSENARSTGVEVLLLWRELIATFASFATMELQTYVVFLSGTGPLRASLLG